MEVSAVVVDLGRLHEDWEVEKRSGEGTEFKVNTD